jgi:hypothetical protein
MNRCILLPPPQSSFVRLAVFCAWLGASLCAWSQESVRPFPAGTQRGILQVTQPPEVLLDGKHARLSPGARIRGENNLLLLSGSLVGRNLVVNYVRDAQGMIHDVWLLNAAETRQNMPGAPAQSNYVSDPTPPATDGEAAAATMPKKP